MADVDLQALLDPTSNRTGIMIERRSDSGLKADYFCTGQVLGHGKAMWVQTLYADSDATKNTAIRAAFGIG